MIVITTKYINNTKDVMREYELNKGKFLQGVAEVGLKSIKEETPVITGKLKDGNTATIGGDEVVFSNNISYFIFVHGGTVYQAANPFMQRGIIKSTPAIEGLLVKNLSVR